MFRKLALAAAAALTLGVGLAGAPAPAAAQGIGFYFGGPGWAGPYYHRYPRYPRYYGYGYYPRYPRYYYGGPRECERVVVRRKIRGEWRRVVERRCYRDDRW